MYINIEPNYFDHLKTMRLKARLGQCADIYPIRLWAFCARHQDDGDLTDYTISEIGQIIGATSAPAMFVSALIDTGFLTFEDGNVYKVNGWDKHQGHIKPLKDRARKGAAARWKKIKDNDAIPTTQTSNAKGTDKQCLPAAQAMLPTQTSNTPHRGKVRKGKEVVKEDERYSNPLIYNAGVIAGYMQDIQKIERTAYVAKALEPIMFWLNEGVSIDDCKRAIKYRWKLCKEDKRSREFFTIRHIFSVKTFQDTLNGAPGATKSALLGHDVVNVVPVEGRTPPTKAQVKAFRADLKKLAAGKTINFKADNVVR